MTTLNYWTRHYQSIWLERAADTSLSDWLRLGCLAFAKHRANGHANFAPGEIGLLLAKAGQDGKVRPLTKSSVSNAITRAEAKRWIALESTARCLVVPPHAIAGGMGNTWDVCRAHPRKNLCQRELTSA